MPILTLKWENEGLSILDQRLLPVQEKYITLKTTDEVCDAIYTLAVRGAPAIGVSAAYGVVVAARENTELTHVRDSIAKLRKTRPTAVNLFYALDRMEKVLPEAFNTGDPVNYLLENARAIHDEDMSICRSLSFHGAELLRDGDTVLTHCNAGALATSGYGTALGVIYAAMETGKKIKVFADETRPLLQGGRLTAWELAKNDVPITVICDNMAAAVMRMTKIDHVIVGADRIASNGDTANKIGTYGLSISAKEHGVPFYVAAPLTTFDFTLETGAEIPIEERKASEIYGIWSGGKVPENIDFFNPAFDVTPAENISAIICEKGVACKPFEKDFGIWKKG